MQRFIKWLAVITSLDLLVVLLGGALVTKTGSGQGRGKSWPLCNGELVPSNLSMETIIELSHRLTSGSAGILVTLLCILSWKYYKHVRETKTLAILSFVFLVAQALMGACNRCLGSNASCTCYPFWYFLNFIRFCYFVNVSYF